MSRYRKKLIEIEAFQLGVEDMPDWFMDKVSENEIILYGQSTKFKYSNDTSCDIKTSEGLMHANYGDYVIKDENGEIYPCTTDIFEEEYEEI